MLEWDDHKDVGISDGKHFGGEENSEPLFLLLIKVE